MHVRKQASQGERPAQAQPPSFSPSQLAPSGTRLPACAARSCRSPSSPALSPSQRPCLRHGDGLRGSRALSAVPVWAGQAVLECVFGSSGNICSVTALPRLLPRLPASGLAPREGEPLSLIFHGRAPHDDDEAGRGWCFARMAWSDGAIPSRRWPACSRCGVLGHQAQVRLAIAMRPREPVLVSAGATTASSLLGRYFGLPAA